MFNVKIDRIMPCKLGHLHANFKLAIKTQKFDDEGIDLSPTFLYYLDTEFEKADNLQLQ
jgi:hypothetical protein